MHARFELAKAGLVFVTKDGAKHFPDALERFKKVMAANPALRLTRQETNAYGELLIAAKDYPTAGKVYHDLLTNAAPTDTLSLGDANYGLGAVALAQGDVAGAKKYFLALKAVTPWHPHISEANYGIALADEQSADPADLNAAKDIYGTVMLQPESSVALQAKSMIGYGRILEKTGFGLKPVTAGSTDNAVFYYIEPQLHFFGPTAPEDTAEGLYRAAQLYQKAGDKVNAKKWYDELLKNYATAAPDWSAKAKDAEAKL